MNNSLAQQQHDSVVYYGKYYMKYLEDTLDSNKKYRISNGRQCSILAQIADSYDKINEIDSAIIVYNDIIADGEKAFSNAYDKYRYHYYRAKLKLKNGDINAACDDIDKATRFVATWDEDYKAALLIKDTICNNYLLNKEIERKKKDNPNYGNQAELFSLIGEGQDDVVKSLGKPIGKTLEHRGEDSYDCYVYKNKNGEYRIAFRNGAAIVVFMYPYIKQKFGEDHLWNGGKFDIENNNVGSCIVTSSKGFVGNVSYFSRDYDCDGGNYSVVFYGTPGGYVSKALAF